MHRIFSFLLISLLLISCVLEKNPAANDDLLSGLSWKGTKFQKINDEYPSVTGLAVNSSDDVFACTNTGGIYRMLDQDSSWQRITSIGLPCTFVQVDSADALYAGYKSYGQLLGGGIIYSADNGERWDFFFNQLISAASLAVKNDEIYFCGTPDGVFHSQDSGQSWQQKNDGLMDTRIYTIAYDTINELLYAGTDSLGVYRSFDDGDSWEQTGLEGRTFNDLTVSAAGNAFAGTSFGIYRSKNSGNSWKRHKSGIRRTSVYSIKALRQTILLAGTAKGVYYSPNSGSNWYLLGLEDKRIIDIDINSNGRIYAAVDSFGVMQSIESIFQ